MSRPLNRMFRDVNRRSATYARVFQVIATYRHIILPASCPWPAAVARCFLAPVPVWQRCESLASSALVHKIGQRSLTPEADPCRLPCIECLGCKETGDDEGRVQGPAAKAPGSAAAPSY